jgi:hypothetical protein
MDPTKPLKYPCTRYNIHLATLVIINLYTVMMSQSGDITKCAEDFRRLKEMLTTTPILKFFDIDVDFLVCTNASKEGLGKVFMQYGRVTTYILRKLRRHEENYVTHYLELLAIVYSLRVWRHYLIG